MATLKELLTARYGKDTGLGDNSQAEAGIEALLSRRSLRLYKDEPVSDELLDVLLGCAQSAPSKSNLQQYSIIVVK
ncbi:MAG: nitroreductase family protein, partial [Alphaproteobacteria bacterium]